MVEFELLNRMIYNAKKLFYLVTHEYSHPFIEVVCRLFTLNVFEDT